MSDTERAWRVCRFCQKRLFGSADLFEKHQFDCLKKSDMKALSNVCPRCGTNLFKRSLAAVAKSYGWPNSQTEMIDEDLGKSGSSSERRTGCQRLQMIDANQVGAVFVATISRLSRQVLDFELFRLRAAFHNTCFIQTVTLLIPQTRTVRLFRKSQQ
jgi:hypothetical protein